MSDVPTATFINFDIICKACRFVCSSTVATEPRRSL